MNSIQLLFAFASTVIPGALSVQASGKVSFYLKKHNLPDFQLF